MRAETRKVPEGEEGKMHGAKRTSVFYSPAALVKLHHRVLVSCDRENILYTANIPHKSPVRLFFCPHSDNQAVRHRHCANTRSPPPPHYADHGLRAAVLPEATQHGEDRSREELQYAVLAGVSKTHDGWKLHG